MRFISLIFLLLAGILYLFVPYTYNLNYCVVQFIFALFSSILFLCYKSKEEGIFNFHLIFIFSYISVNFLHAIFVFPDDNIFPVFKFPYNYKIIPYALSIAQLGLQSYIIGVIYCPSSKVKNYNEIGDMFNNGVVKRIENLSLFMSGLLLLYVFIFMKISSGLEHLYPRLMILIVASIALSVLLRALLLNQQGDLELKNIVFFNRKNLISIFFFVSSLLYIGSRGSVIFLLLFVAGVVHRYYFKIKAVFFLPMFLIMLLFMAIITITRITDVNFTTSSVTQVLKYGYNYLLESPDASLVVLTDLIVNARNLYDGVDYVNYNGLLYGQSFFPYLFVFIPFGASFFTQFFLGKTTMEVSTGMILTEWNRAGYGLGTSVVGDIYMNFSLLGVIVLSFFLGFIVRYSEQRSGIWSQILYFSLLAFSFYIPRASILCWTDLFAMIVLIYIFFNTKYRCWG